MNFNRGSRRFLVVCTTILLFGLLSAVTDVLAVRKGSKQDRSGVVTDSLYIDSLYKYSFPIGDQWKIHLEKAVSDIRITMFHRHPGPFASLYPNRIQATVLRVAQKSGEVIDSMSSADGSWEVTKRFWADSKPNMTGTIRVSRVQVETRKPVMLSGRTASEYVAKVYYKFGPGGGEYQVGAVTKIVAVDIPEGVLIITGIYDLRYRVNIEEEFSRVLGGLRWLE